MKIIKSVERVITDPIEFKLDRRFSQDIHGNTALHIAVAMGRKDCIKLLLAYNSPVKLKNTQGKDVFRGFFSLKTFENVQSSENGWTSTARLVFPMTYNNIS